uniref:Uncharacterized protein n=1 Tax=Poecilia formosa TaxID=48698 RepID=A0A096M526_POEFO
LRRRLAHQTTLSGSDPFMTSAVAVQEPAEQIISLTADAGAGTSWGEILNSVDPLPSEVAELCFESCSLDFPVTGDCEFSDSEPELPFLDNDEDYDPSPPLSGRVAKPAPSGAGQPGHEGSSSPELDFDLHDVCKRTAAKLDIQWPEVQAELPKARKTGRQLLPVFPELLEELAVSWRNKPFKEKHPVAGSSVLDCDGMEKCGLRQLPPVEPAVAAHLHPKTSMSAGGPTLPSRADRFQSSLTDKSYRAAALSVQALNASSLLMAYQAELEEQMTTLPDAALWEEVCIITDHCLQLHKVAIQALGRTMGLMVLQERARWLNFTTLSIKEKEDLLDTAITPEGLFGAAVNSMQKRWEEKKRDDEALKLCLPRRTFAIGTTTPSTQRHTFAQAAARFPNAFKIPKFPKTQGAAQAPQKASVPKAPWQRKPDGPRSDQPPPHSPSTQNVRRRKRLA